MAAAAERNVECVVCLNYYDDPVRLAVCNHTFCRQCVNLCAIAQLPPGQGQQEQALNICCPLCRRVTLVANAVADVDAARAAADAHIQQQQQQQQQQDEHAPSAPPRVHIVHNDNDNDDDDDDDERPAYDVLVSALSNNPRFLHTIKSSLVATGTVVACVAPAATLLGPAGILIGGLIGTTLAYFRADDYDSLLSILRDDLSVRDQNRLAFVAKECLQQLNPTDIQNAVANFQNFSVAAILPLLVADQNDNNLLRVIRAIVSNND
jgi:hypothetical protein